MKRFRVWGVSAALTCGLGVPVALADPPAAEQTTLMKKLFGPRQPKPAGPTVAANSDRPPTIQAPLAPEVLADALRAEQDAYLRRISVCTELRRVAIEKGNDALARQADELERQASQLYNLRVAGLGVPRGKTPATESARGSDTLDRGAASTQAITQARRLEAASNPVPGTTTAQVREVKP